MPLTARDVAEITRLLEESDFEELRLEHEGFKLTLRRGAAGRREPAASAAAQSYVPATFERGPRAAPAPGTDPSVLEITAPLVGIFYRAPRPGAPPFVEVGTQLEEDSIVGILEVMKLMNAVRAEVRGTVLEILVKDGEVVEYGQVLLRVSRGAGSG